MRSLIVPAFIKLLDVYCKISTSRALQVCHVLSHVAWAAIQATGRQLQSLVHSTKNLDAKFLQLPKLPPRPRLLCPKP